MKDLRRYQFIIFSLIMSYFLFAYVIATFTRSGELFPFFSGHWFTRAPHTFHDYGIKVLAINGEPIKNGVYLDQKQSPFQNSWAFRRYIISQNLGENISRKDVEAINKDLSTLKLSIFGSQSTVFQVDRRTFNSLEYITSGNIITAETIYESGNSKNE